VPYAKTKDKTLVNEVTLGDGYPLSDNLQAIKVGGEASVLQLSSPIPHTTTKGKVKVDGDLEVTGSILKQSTLHFINGGAYNTGTSKFYLPLTGYNLERTSLASANEFLGYVTPYDGRLKKLVLRSENACLTTTGGFHKSSEGTEVPNSTSSEDIEVEMAADDTAYTFDFTGTSSFVAGDIIAVSVNPESSVGDLVWTVVLEYYID
tara:strand:- start:1031 stop:1648 length:618 start_codon:yes stop_codon:yes gene_type:complete